MPAITIEHEPLEKRPETGAGRPPADPPLPPSPPEPPGWPCPKCGRYETETCPQWRAEACPHGRGKRPADAGPVIPRSPTVTDPWGDASRFGKTKG